MTEKPWVVAWFVGDPVDPADPLAAVKLRAAELCDPHYQAGQSAGRLYELARLFGSPEFDPFAVGDAARAAGMSEADIDAASYAALMLRAVEMGER